MLDVQYILLDFQLVPHVRPGGLLYRRRLSTIHPRDFDTVGKNHGVVDTMVVRVEGGVHGGAGPS